MLEYLILTGKGEWERGLGGGVSLEVDCEGSRVHPLGSPPPPLCLWTEMWWPRCFFSALPAAMLPAVVILDSASGTMSPKGKLSFVRSFGHGVLTQQLKSS